MDLRDGSRIDLRGGFHQIVLHKDSRSITTFRTPLGLKRYKRLSMGVCCASEIFQHEVEKCLNGLHGVKNLVDDIFVWGTSQEEHDKNLFKLLDRLLSLGLTVNPDKCIFRRTSLEFFGLRFSNKGVSLSDTKIKAIKEAKQSSTASELRSFLGLAVFCSRHIPKLASLAAPLWDLVRKAKPNNKLEWQDIHTQALDRIKDGILNKAMGYFNKDWRTHLEVDASPYGTGAHQCIHLLYLCVAISI